ncbi:MAG: hypothetical protein SGI77_22490 [Pirellulaceae bacterium]|nr:hypothetical protein [Pirellulaceae bacterium]
MLNRQCKPSRFETGQLVLTPKVMEEICPYDAAEALDRHRQGDWGLVCEDDKLANDFSLEERLGLLSKFEDSKGICFWIMTEADRSATMILLPEEY